MNEEESVRVWNEKWLLETTIIQLLALKDKIDPDSISHVNINLGPPEIRGENVVYDSVSIANMKNYPKKRIRWISVNYHTIDNVGDRK